MARKQRLSVYLDPRIAFDLEDYCDREGQSLSLAAEAAIESFVSPDAAKRRETAIEKRLDRLSEQLVLAQRDLEISTEALALFVRFWLQTVPQSPDRQDPSARARGIERYSRFIEALGRKLSDGPSVAHEVAAQRADIA